MNVGRSQRNFWFAPSLRVKLVLLSVGITSLSLFAGFLMIAWKHNQTLREEMLQKAEMVAQFAGDSLISSLIFQDTEAARETLQLFSAMPLITQASLFDKRGEVFAEYAPTDEQLRMQNNSLPREASTFVDDKLLTKRDLILDGESVGVLLVVTSTNELRQKVFQGQMTLLGILLVALLCALITASFLEKFISSKISYLAEVMRTIVRGADYSAPFSAVLSNDEIGDLYESFDVMIKHIQERERQLLAESQRAEEALATKSDFLARVSHEMRTPLHAIMSLTELMQRSVNLSEEDKEDLQTLRSSARDLKVTIDDLLDYSKMEAGKLSLVKESFNLKLTLSDLIKLLQVESAKKEQYLICEIDNDIPDMLLGDQHRIKQIVTNILGNAIKFTSKEGGIAVQLHLLRAEDTSSTIALTVSDSGVGIPEDCQSMIFSPFTQASDSTTRRFGGTGLGLSIVSSLTKLMGGEVLLQSREGVGTAIRLVLTLEHPNLSSDLDVSGQASFNYLLNKTQLKIIDNEQPIVLVVEDNRVNRETIERLLATQGFHVVLAESIAVALSILERDPIDVILMDLHMPEMGGIEGTRLIRESQKPFSNVPVIALTADVAKGLKERCLEGGMNAFMTKPINYPLLIEQIRNFSATNLC